MSIRRDFHVRILHVPTGITAQVDSFCSRTTGEAREKAMKLLRSRVWAAQRGLREPMPPEVAAYELPGDMDSPHDLGEYRRNLRPHLR